MRIACALWEATRPRMFPVWLSSGLIPASVAWSRGVFDPATFILETLLCYALLTLSCWADELGDLDHGVDNEHRLGPVRPLQRGDMSRREMLLACAILGCVCVAVGLSLLIWSFSRNPEPFALVAALVVVGFGLVGLAFAYTMGERPYGYLGLGDLVAFLCFGPVACGCGYWLYAHAMDWSVLLPACAAGLLLAATMNLQNVRDIENDLACGKVTPAGLMGVRGAVRYQWVLVFGGIACYLAYFPASGLLDPWRMIACSACFLPLVFHCTRFSRMVARGDFSALDDLMRPLTLGMLVACLAFCGCVVL